MMLENRSINSQIEQVKEKAEDLVFRMFVTFFLIGAIILIGVFAFAYIDGKESMVQELCSKQQYDFCKVKHISYELRSKNDSN